MIILKLALRNIFRHATRSLITLSAIAFGCISIILVDGFFNDLFVKMREGYTRQHTGHIQIYRKGYAERGAAKPFDFLIDDPSKVTEIIKNISGVQYFTSRLQFAGLLSNGENTAACFGISIEPESEFMTDEKDPEQAIVSTKNMKLGVGSIVDGKALEKGDDFGILLGTGLAKSLGIKPGDGLVLLSNTTTGSINAIDVTARGAFRSAAKEFDDRVLRVPYTAAKTLLHTEAVQSIMIILLETEDTDRVVGELQKAFSEQKLELEIKTWRDLNDYYFKTRALFGRFFIILIIVVVIVVILSIFNTMNMAVLERTNEIGTIRALGHRRQEIVQLFILEGLLLGALGGIVGALAGSIITRLVAFIGIKMPPPPGATIVWLSEPQLSGGAIITAAIISVVTAVVSSIYPARKASRLEIAEALRHVS